MTAFRFLVSAVLVASAGILFGFPSALGTWACALAWIMMTHPRRKDRDPWVPYAFRNSLVPSKPFVAHPLVARLQESLSRRR